MAWVECEYPLTAVIEEEIEEGDEVVDPPLVVDPTEPTPVTASAVVSNEFDITVDGQPI